MSLSSDSNSLRTVKVPTNWACITISEIRHTIERYVQQTANYNTGRYNAQLFTASV